MSRAATTSDVFNAIAEPRRREIIGLLAGGQARSVNDLVEAMGLAMQVDAADVRLPQLNVVKAPPGVDEAAIRRDLLTLNDIEIGGASADLTLTVVPVPEPGTVLGIALLGLLAARCTRRQLAKSPRPTADVSGSA